MSRTFTHFYRRFLLLTLRSFFHSCRGYHSRFSSSHRSRGPLHPSTDHPPTLCSNRRYSPPLRYRTFAHDSLLPLPRHSWFPHRHSRLGTRQCHSSNRKEPRFSSHLARYPTPCRLDLLPHLLRHRLPFWRCRSSPPSRSPDPLLRQACTPRIDSSCSLRRQIQHVDGSLGNSLP